MRSSGLFSTVVVVSSAGAVLSAAQRAQAAFTPTLVARTATVVPNTGGASAGLTILSQSAGPGQILMSMTMNDPVMPSQGFSDVVWNNGVLARMSSPGMPAPGMPGVTLQSQLLARHGSTNVLTGTRVGPGFDSTSRALWFGTDGNYELLGTAGMPVPGGPGLQVRNLRAWAVGNGRAAIEGLLLNTQNGDDTGRALYEAQSGSLTLLARSNTMAPAPVSANIRTIRGALVATATGEIITQLETGQSNQSLWHGRNGQLHHIISAGTPIPNSGFTADGPRSSSVNQHGVVSTITQLDGPGVNLTNNSALVIGSDDDDLRIALREGSLLPGSSLICPDLIGETGTSINASGSVALLDEGRLFTGNDASWRKVTELGEAAPGTSESFTTLDQMSITGSGAVVFRGITTNTSGLYAALPDGTIQSLVKIGDALDIGNGQTRIVANISFVGGNNEGGAFSKVSSLDDLICFDVRFTTNSAGTYYVQLPEPGIATATGWLACSMFRRLPRQRGRAGAPNALARRA